jgi:acid stress chaperone HdeB
MRFKILFVAAAMLAGATLQSAAQISVDMNRITCGNFIGYSPDIRDFVRFWMSGYYNAAANSNVLNYDRFQGNSAKIVAYCKKNKSKTLPTAIKNLGLWN